MGDQHWARSLPVDSFRLSHPPDSGVVERAESELGVSLPPELRDLYRESDGVFDTAGQWFVIWPLADVVTRNRAAWDAAQGLDRRALLAFGDDGTGDPFCVPCDGSRAVVVWSEIDGSATYMADDIERFWSAWTSGTLPHY
jgi:hypothetical protein